ncbi:MAG: hypothetical protein WCG40_07720 [Actinomycetes bacterium]
MRILPFSAKHAIIFGGVFFYLVTGCSTTTTNYKSEGEKFLESSDQARIAGYTFSNALCDKPQSTKVGTQYPCSATDNDGDSWEFIIEITGDRELTVIKGDVVR